MKAPRFYLAVVVLFWGWQVELLPAAVGMAVLLESAGRLKLRFDFTPEDLNKWVDVSTIILAITIVAALVIDAQKAMRMILKWMPVVTFPVMAAQEFSRDRMVDIRSFSPSARTRAKRGDSGEGEKIDLSYIYSLFCLLSAGTANVKGPLYYAAAAFFFAWGLFPVRSTRGRSRKIRDLVWAMAIILTLLLGYAGQAGIRQARIFIYNRIMEYYADYYETNPFRTHSMLGEMGRLKLSDRIIARARFDNGYPGQIYRLHTATYNRYAVSNWFARFPFQPVIPGGDGFFWQIQSPVKEAKSMTLYFKPRKRAVLSLPRGVVSIDKMDVVQCERNPMQSVRVTGGAPLIKAVVRYTDGLQYDPLPDETDLIVPPAEAPGVKKIVERLNLTGQTEQEILKRVKRFFFDEYEYSLDLAGKRASRTALDTFLNQTRKGHCEYFATAAALVLRQAGIPARYATGFIAHEHSRLEQQIIVRQRDAHSWVRAYVNGRWQDYDTTPPSFIEADSRAVSTWLVADLASFIGFQLSRLRHETGEDLLNRYGLWLILPLGIILVFRLKRSGRAKRVREVSEKGRQASSGKRPDAFEMLEDFLSKKGFVRYPHETYASWLVRIEPLFDRKEVYEKLKHLLSFHYRKRFSEKGLTPELEKTLLVRAGEIRTELE